MSSDTRSPAETASHDLVFRPEKKERIPEQ